MKKQYVTPKISVIVMEPLQIMAGSIGSDRGWTPDGDENNGFSVLEEEENLDHGQGPQAVLSG